MGIGSVNWIIWSLVALAAVLFILGLLQMLRRQPLVDEKKGSVRGLGFLTLLSGLLLGLISWFIWQPTLTGLSSLRGKYAALQNHGQKLSTENTRLSKLLSSKKDGAIEIKRLKGVVTGLSGNLADMKSENKRLNDELSTNKISGNEVTRLNSVVSRLTKDNTDIKAENTRLTGLLDTRKTDGKEVTRLNGDISRLKKDNTDITAENTRLTGLLTAFRNDTEVKDAKIKSLEAGLAKQKTRSVTAPPVRKKAPLALINQHSQDSTRFRLKGNSYTIEKMRNQGLVRGKKGTYYRVALKQPNGMAYKFASGSYSKIIPEAPFKQSLDNAIRDILSGLDGRRHYQLYARGNASGGKFTGRLEAGYKYHHIKVLEKGLRNKYDDEPDNRYFVDTIHNKDLPNLRGAYLQDIIGKNYYITKPVILDGEVSGSMDEAEQAVVLILYVED